ncbi:hypothetical protein BC939DRAFT_146435 [Gamsiella multidivaricata]|uniref:uncharacterized protein n=1 Tax=Gamsiella multidivaricata TaxID=101098 RepID=UPI00221FEEC8|nr:uncharacterized protein BC939DRAFT_146435 [Gamsiella multidivaricata]KAI7831664.1 hypothetical protein BC939DRAFT_146435 [Gamsiella multidivaricata]
MHRLASEEGSVTNPPIYIKEAPQTPDFMPGVPIYNILLFGPRRSGKSTFLEAIKTYADSSYQINYGALDAFRRADLQVESVETDFPEYRLHLKKPNSQLEALRDEADITSFFNPTPGITVETIKGDSKLPKSVLRIFDTLGLDDTDSHDEANVAKILSRLSNVESIHLVLIFISRHTALTSELQSTLKTYRNIFSAMGSLLAFVHTKIDLRDQYLKDENLWSHIEQKKGILGATMGRDIPHYLIDCELDEIRPAYLYLRQLKIRQTLLLAKFNVPVPMHNLQVTKTPRMTEIDNLVIQKSKCRLAEIEKATSPANPNICNVDSKIIKTRYDIREHEEYIRNHNTDDVELIHEAYFEQAWHLFSKRDEARLKAKHLDDTIDDIRVELSGVEIKKESGGKGFNYWSVRLIRKHYMNGTFHAKLYTTRHKKYRQELCEWDIKLDGAKTILEGLHRERKLLDSADIGDDATQVQRQQLSADQSRYWNIITRASRLALHLNLFKAIVEAGVYEGRPVDCVQKVIDFYSVYRPMESEEAILRPDESQPEAP